MNNTVAKNTIEIQDVIDEYCQAVCKGESVTLRRICLPSTEFIGYTRDGSLVRQDLSEFTREAVNDDFAWRNELYSNATIMSVDYLDEDVVIAKIMMGNSTVCCNEILSLREINDKWWIVGRIFTEVSRIEDTSRSLRAVS